MPKPNIKYAGIDGCPSGWFYIGIDEQGQFHAGVHDTFESTIKALSSASLILVDMPIGLPYQHHAKRPCDVAARNVVTPRGSSVFPVPARSALHQPTHEAASTENSRVLGKRLSAQSWAIAPKIREVDNFMGQLGTQARVREMHPEVAFWALNFEQPLLEKKKSRAGELERISVLSQHYPRSEECFEACKKRFPRKAVAKDDILDALSGAVTAMQAPNLETLPPNPGCDEIGLPMEIVYARVQRKPSLSQGLFHHELEAAAAETLGRIVFAFTRFEYNLALALKFAIANPGEPAFENWKSGTFSENLKNLQALIELRFEPDSRCASEFSDWYNRVDRVRRKRNAFVHGRWDVRHAIQQVVNISDDYPGVDEKGKTVFSLGSLKKELDDIEQLEREFYRMRNTHTSFHVTP